MPTYEYACRECEKHLEAVQKFTDDPLTTCPSCGGTLRKVFGSVGISFKGSGFYKTDSRSGSKKSSESAAAKSSESSSSGDSGTSTSTEKKADAPKPAAATTSGSAAAS